MKLILGKKVKPYVKVFNGEAWLSETYLLEEKRKRNRK